MLKKRNPFNDPVAWCRLEHERIQMLRNSNCFVAFALHVFVVQKFLQLQPRCMKLQCRTKADKDNEDRRNATKEEKKKD